MKKVISIILLVIWLGVIFTFSNQTASKSTKMSDNATIKIVEISSKLTKKEYSDNEKKDIIKKNKYLVRKTAHFALYFILGILVYNVLCKFEIKKKFLISLVICIFYAVSDEIHQMFIDERTAKLFDVFIDTCGSFISLFICIHINKIQNKKSGDKI